MRKTINIGEKIIGDNQETFVTFEAGPTHNGFSDPGVRAHHQALSGRVPQMRQVWAVMAQDEQAWDPANGQMPWAGSMGDHP